MIDVILKNDFLTKKLSFPCTEKELEDALLELHLGRTAVTGIYISQVEHPEEFKFFENQIVNLDELNYLAKRMESFFGENEFSQFFEAMKHEGFTEMKDIINLTFNMHRYPLIQDISNTTKIGREYFFITQGAIPAHDEDNPKYAEKGRELIRSGKGIMTEHGLLFVNEEIPFEEPYDGDVFPFYLYDSGHILTVIMQYNDKKELLALPCEEIAIHKACKRLKAPNKEEIAVELEAVRFDNSEWMRRMEDILREQGISAANLLAQAISDYDVNFKKLSALVSYANADEARDIIKLIENEESFRYFEFCGDFEAVAKKFIEAESDEYYVSDSLEDFLDYEAFGQAIDRENNGKFVENGYVCMVNGVSLELILGKNLPKHNVETKQERSVDEYMEELENVTECFYFPLQGEIEEEMDRNPVDESYILAYKEAIQATIEKEHRECGDLARFFGKDKDIKENLISAIWCVKEINNELYGCVQTKWNSKPDEQEKEKLKEWIIGQNADGFGEGFEQQAIAVDNGDLYISFWNNGNDYFVFDSNEMQEYLSNQFGMQIQM